MSHEKPGENGRRNQCDLIPTEKEDESSINLHNQGKVRARAAVRRGERPQGRGYRLEALSQRDVPGTPLDLGRRFVVVLRTITEEPSMSECWNRNVHFPRHRLLPKYRRDESPYDLAPTPCAFWPLQC